MVLFLRFAEFRLRVRKFSLTILDATPVDWYITSGATHIRGSHASLRRRHLPELIRFNLNQALFLVTVAWGSLAIGGSGENLSSPQLCQAFLLDLSTCMAFHLSSCVRWWLDPSGHVYKSDVQWQHIQHYADKDGLHDERKRFVCACSGRASSDAMQPREQTAFTCRIPFLRCFVFSWQDWQTCATNLR